MERCNRTMMTKKEQREKIVTSNKINKRCDNTYSQLGMTESSKYEDR